MLVKSTLLVLLTLGITMGAVTKLKQTKLEKRIELQGVYQIQSPTDQSTLALGKGAVGNPPLKVLVTASPREGALGQSWTIATSGPPVSRVATIFNQMDTENVLSHEFGFPGTKFTRTWQALDGGSGTVILRNLGLCLTRQPKGKVDRRECGNGKKPSDAQKWRMIFIKELQEDPNRNSHPPPE